MSTAALLAEIAAAVPSVGSQTAVFVRMQGAKALVTIGSSTVPIPSPGYSPPIPGMIVQLETLDGVLRVVGPAVPISPRGRIIGLGTPLAQVEVGGVSRFLPYVSLYTPKLRDEVAIDWGAQIILGPFSAEPPAPELPPPTAPAGGSFAGLMVQAQSSGNWWMSGGSWNSNDPWASTNNQGAWFYGTTIRDTLAGASIATAEMYLPATALQNVVQLGVHPHPARPGGAPALSALNALPRAEGWVGLPAGFAQALQTGASLGLGVRSTTGFNKFRGVPSDPLSGALRFSGTR